MKRIDDIHKLGHGQKVYCTGYNEKLSQSMLIIGEFNLKSGSHLNLINYSIDKVDLKIESSDEKDVRRLLNKLYNNSEKFAQSSFILTDYKDFKLFI